MTMSLCGAVPRDIGFCLFSYPRVKSEIYRNFYNFSFSFLTHESKIKYDKYLTDPLGPIKRDCDTNHYKPIITVGVAFNHDNELYWGSTTRYRFLFSFLTKESKIKYDIIFYRPIWGPLRGIVTPTTVYQYLQ